MSQFIVCRVRLRHAHGSDRYRAITSASVLAPGPTQLASHSLVLISACWWYRHAHIINDAFTLIAHIVNVCVICGAELQERGLDQ